ncbi:MAG: hypothetical protein Q9178_007283 [Gyalolechia marmorata]
MEEVNPRLITTLVAGDALAERAWIRPENEDRCQPASKSDDRNVDIPSRGTTPGISDTAEALVSKIHLSMDHGPKNPDKGFVFGSDPVRCDVVIGEWPAFSREHFRITFNARGDVILKDTSRFPTSVNYKHEAPSSRNHFTWVLLDDYENIHVTLNCGKPNQLIFKIERPHNRKHCLSQYEAYREIYLNRERHSTLPLMGQLGVESQQPTATVTASESPRQHSIYLKQAKLGAGTFGTVYKVVDVSTGSVYAGKASHDGSWHNEINIMRRLSQEHIISFIDFSEEFCLLVMEYLPLGSLSDLESVSEEETLQVLHQGLAALEYLHAQHIAHRDIKPENILIQCRVPFTIKLADFGLAKTDSFLKSKCGSDPYAAPEIWEGYSYTQLVDIWSLGVVIVQFMYGLPKPSQKRRTGKLWCRDIARYAADMEGKEMELVSENMLMMDPQQRLSATDCLIKLRDLGLDKIQSTGRIIPTDKAHGRVAVSEGPGIAPSTLKLREDAPSRSLESHIRGSAIQAREPYTLAAAPARTKRGLAPRSHSPMTGKTAGFGRGHEAEVPTEPKRLRGRDQVLSRATTQSQGSSQFDRSTYSDGSNRAAADARGAQGKQPKLTIGMPAYPPSRLEPQFGAQENLAENVSPLRKASALATEIIETKSMKQLPPFIQIKVASRLFSVRRSDFRIRINDIWRASDKPRGKIEEIRREFPESSDIDYNFKFRGIYIDFWVGVELCRRYGLTELENALRLCEDVPAKGDIEECRVSQSELSADFIELAGTSKPVMFPISDSRVNATHIFRLLGRTGTDIAKYRDTLSPQAYVTLRGHARYQGTYVDLLTAIKLCQKYELQMLEEQLRTLTPVVVHSQAEPIGGVQASETENRELCSDSAAASSDSENASPVSQEPHHTRRSPERDIDPHSIPDKPDPSLQPPNSHSQYETWDSQPQLSHLSEMKPVDLRPSSRKTGSHYGESIGDLFPAE